MADYDDYDDNEQQNDSMSPRDLRVQLKEAKAAAKEANELREQVKRLQQEGTIRDAGLTLNEQQRVALAAVHSGEWNSDAIKQTASTLGFYSPQQPAPVVDDPSLSQIDQIASASAGTETLSASRDAELDAQLAKATSPEEFMSIYRTSGRRYA
jgi:DNA-binding Lrp family transcriptional regulator